MAVPEAVRTTGVLVDALNGIVLAALGEIPKCLANLKPPVCAGCAFGAMTKVLWQSKG